MTSATVRLFCYIAEINLWFLSLVVMTLRSAVELIQFVIMLIRAFIRNVEPEAAILGKYKVAIATPPETLFPDATVGPLPTDNTTQQIVPPVKTRPITKTSIGSTTMTGISHLNATVVPGKTDGVNMSSSQKPNTAATVRSITCCKKTIISIFNVMNEQNLQTKCNEVKDIIVETEEECIPWLARYIVTNHINIKSNFHTVYLNFLNSLNSEALIKLITLETEKSIKSFLSLGEVSPICRNTLINLGSLYGMMTIAKNKPISTSFEDLKTLLIKAYQGGEDKLMNTLLIVTRILETCAYSTVFNTTSPWTLDILYCLSDLYRQPNLKLKFQFEIEILCKRLKVELEDLKPATSYFINNA
ncbi:CCR4-NOT transcription complex subunit 1, CAF1-binding domain [Cinara cedri]|uniref:CCR4-NOT transcription complex subunit 1, CAF1-binding domain n=1 Tax=Cinara cedri TaxID=506608 RepID=A0A5E4NA73_9HEMI|nr:CCR4-NOT transcription complex subunit 1, CAF1-binding domain [Cinara cedri]